MCVMAFQSTTTRLFVQHFIRVNTKGHITLTKDNAENVSNSWRHYGWHKVRHHDAYDHIGVYMFTESQGITCGFNRCIALGVEQQWIGNGWSRFFNDFTHWWKISRIIRQVYLCQTLLRQQQLAVRNRFDILCQPLSRQRKLVALLLHLNGCYLDPYVVNSNPMTLFRCTLGCVVGIIWGSLY